MSTHTPGLYEVFYQGRDAEIRTIKQCPNDTTKASLEIVAVVKRVGSEAEMLANANMFAAAPEMLKTLKEAVTWLGFSIAQNVHAQCVAPGRLPKVLVRAMELINKADSSQEHHPESIEASKSYAYKVARADDLAFFVEELCKDWDAEALAKLKTDARELLADIAKAKGE